MRTIYLHIGPNKTGTTAIQNSLRNNREHLFKHGVDYAMINPRNPIATIPFAVQSGNLPRYVRNHPQKLPLFLRNLVENCTSETIIVSSEILTRILSKNNTLLYELIELSQASNIKLVFVTVLRDFVSRTRSSYSQAMKRGETLTFDEFLMDRDLSGFFNVLKEIRKHKFSTLFIEYSPAKNLVQRFWDELNLPYPGHEINLTSNRSLQLPEIALVQAFEFLNNSLNEKEKKTSPLTPEFIVNFNKVNSTPKWYCSEASANKFKQKYDPVIRQINDLISDFQLPYINIEELTNGESVTHLNSEQLQIFAEWHKKKFVARPSGLRESFQLMIQVIQVKFHFKMNRCSRPR